MFRVRRKKLGWKPFILDTAVIQLSFQDPKK
jgi:hypothetical protein